jgi:hypothetical protein
MPPGAERAEEGEQLPSQLRVRVLKGDGLVPADKGGKSDPYVKLELLQGATGFRSRQTGKTKTVRETTSPVWEEDVLFAVDRESFRAGETLCIELYDWDAVGRDDYLGDIQIDVLALWPGEQWNLSRGGEWGVEDKKGNVKKKHIAASRVRGHRSLGVVTLLFFLEENAAEKSVIEQEEAEAAKAAQLAAQATAIQTVFRRIMARRTFLQERDSTCWLQGKVRGCLVRARLRRQAGACIQIQAGFRGHQGRHVARQARQAALARATAEAAATAASIEAARQKRAREGPLRALRRLQQSHDQPEQMVPMFLGRSSSMARALMASPRCQDVRPVFDALRDEIARRGIDTYVTRPGEFTPRAVVPRPPHSARSWTPGTWTAGQMRPWTSESLFPPGSTMEWRQATVRHTTALLRLRNDFHSPLRRWLRANWRCCCRLCRCGACRQTSDGLLNYTAGRSNCASSRYLVMPSGAHKFCHISQRCGRRRATRLYVTLHAELCVARGQSANAHACRAA